MDDEDEEPMTDAERERVEQWVAEAGDPATPPARLAELREEVIPPEPYWRGTNGGAAAWRKLLGERLTTNPNVPLDVLRFLAHWHPLALLENPILPLIPLEAPNFIAGMSADPLLKLLRREEMPAALVALCRAHRAEEVRDTAEMHVGAAGAADVTTMSGRAEVQATIAAQVERLPVAEWERLWEIVEHDIPCRALAQRVGLAAVHPPTHPEFEAFARRAKQQGRQERQAATKGALLAAPPPEIGRTWMRANPREAARRAGRADCPPDALSLFALEGSHNIKEAALGNPFLPKSVLDELAAKGNYTSAAALSAHPSADAETLRLLFQSVQRTGDLGDMLPVLANPAAPADVVLPVARFVAAPKEDEREYRDAAFPAALARRALRWHPSLVGDAPRLPDPDDPLPFVELSGGRFYGGHHLAAFLVIAAVPLRAEEEASFAASSLWPERLAVALNPHTSDEITATLARDGNRLVRAAAQARLSGRPLFTDG